MFEGSKRKSLDQHLLQNLKLGSREAFTKIYDHFWEEFVIYALKLLHDKEAARDVVQEVFCKVWFNREKIDISNPKGYLLRAVKNGTIDYIRKHQLKFCDEQFLVNEKARNNIEEHTNLSDTTNQIKLWADKLPDKSKEVFYLSRFDHLSNDEISKQLNITKSTVEWHISKSLKFIRMSMSGKNIEEQLLFLFILSECYLC